jgi:hypothetical protein
MAELKPMELGEILDGALTIFRRHFLLFLKIGIVAFWLPVALTVYIQLAGGREQHLLLTVLIWVVQYFAGFFLTAGAIRVISDSYLGQKPQLNDALALGVSKMWPLFFVGLGKGLLLGLIVVVLVAVGLATIPLLAGSGGIAVLVGIALVVAGCWLVIFVACGYAVTTPVVVLENLASSSDAFGRSWELTRRFRRKIFAIFFVTSLIVFLPIFAIGVLGGLLMFEASLAGRAVEVLSAALPVLLTPLFSCVLTLVYYDLRVRREAFDLQVLSQQLGMR